MNPSNFPESNRVLGPPPGSTEDEVGSLFTYTGHGMVISKWKVSAEELEAIQATGEVWLVVSGASMPPVILQTDNPFKPKP